MATLNAVWDELVRRVSFKIGYGRAAPDVGSDEETDINDAIRSGLRSIYHCGHPWRFLYPRAVLETSAPYSEGTITVTADAGGSIVTLAGGTFPTAIPDTGTDTGWRLQVGGDGYEIQVRNSPTELLLIDDDVEIAALTEYLVGQNRYDLPVDFIGFAGKGLFTHSAGTGDLYGPIRIVSEQELRIIEQDFDWSHTPMKAAVIPKPFDAETGQRYQVQFWPMPDREHRFHYRYVHDPEMLDATNVHHWGGTPFSEAVIAACLSAAEEYHDDGSTYWADKFQQKLAIAIDHDKKFNAPDRLGPFYDGSRIVDLPSREEFLVDYRQPMPTVEGN
jgi:hypothetical protein